MKKIALIGALLAMLCVAVVPGVAFANERDKDEVDLEDLQEQIEALASLEDIEDLLASDLEDVDGDGFAGLEELEIEQDIESGDVTQNYDISSTGDNSNQCVGISGTANTGNAANLVPVFNFGDADGDGDLEFELEDVGSDVTVNPENVTTCDQVVSQNAEAYSY